MATLEPVEGDGDEVRCSECDVIFTLFWRRSAGIDGCEYCPFCGDDIDRPENVE